LADAILKVPAQAWTPAYDAGSGLAAAWEIAARLPEAKIVIFTVQLFLQRLDT
jgi:hypothetical protein